VKIRKRALVLYFQPFSSVQLDKMSAAFGLSVAEMEKLAVQLIQEGRIQARVDSKNKVLVVKETDPRTALYSRAVETAARIQQSTQKLLLHTSLVKADLIVKSLKSRGNENQQLPTLIHDGFVVGP